jgi:spore coat polysaccharide biosynthesis protein SpsF
MTRTVAVIQARLGSRRFPGKMLADLGGRPLIEWVVERTRRSRLVDRVVVATTDETLDDRLVAECGRLGVDVRRGSTADVLRRFSTAIADDSADTVVRICADNPFVDPDCIDHVIGEFRSRGVGYAYNHRPFGDCNYADGFGAEVVERALLDRLNESQLSSEHREHVTLALADGTVDVSRHGCAAPPGLARPELGFDVDEPGDLDRLRALVRLGGLTIGSSAGDIIVAADMP